MNEERTEKCLQQVEHIRGHISIWKWEIYGTKGGNNILSPLGR